MTRRPRTTAITILVLACAVLAGCSSGSDPDATSTSTPSATPTSTPTSFTADDLSCDVDRASSHAEDINEQVGGRVEKDFTVRFSQTTKVGVVALVTGDTEKAYELLSRDFGVSIVAKVERDKDPGRITSFAQVTKLVDAVCGPSDQ